MNKINYTNVICSWSIYASIQTVWNHLHVQDHHASLTFVDDGSLRVFCSWHQHSDELHHFAVELLYRWLAAVDILRHIIEEKDESNNVEIQELKIRVCQTLRLVSVAESSVEIGLLAF